jgi:hypothetical protein
MHSSDVRKWINAYEQTHREQDQGRLELDRLGLISRDEDRAAGDSGLDGQWNREHGAWEESRPFDTATRLVVLVGTGIIAALVIFFG